MQLEIIPHWDDTNGNMDILKTVRCSCGRKKRSNTILTHRLQHYNMCRLTQQFDMLIQKKEILLK